MASLGNKFQTARETQGLTLEQMVSRTRIQESHLKALEAGSFEQLPERVFTKGFVRAYARSLGLDEEECLRLFEECSASFYQQVKESEGVRTMFLRKEDVQKERTSRVMVVLLVGGLLLLGGIVLHQQSPSRSIFSRFSQQPVEPRDEVVSKPGPANEGVENRRPSSVEPPDGVSSVANTEPVLETEAAETSWESAVDKGASTPAPSSPDSVPAPASATDSENDPLILEIRTLETTWAVIRSDEDNSHEVLLQAGEVIRRRARDRFLLTLGNAGGVEVRLNGELRGPFGETGVVVRDVELRP
jgi:cytoskeletal protein RodZ